MTNGKIATQVTYRLIVTYLDGDALEDKCLPLLLGQRAGASNSLHGSAVRKSDADLASLHLRKIDGFGGYYDQVSIHLRKR